MTSEHEQSTWKQPGPASGPREVYPGDGSVVTYDWYRLADQPALLSADLSAEQRERLRQRVELLHRHWKSESDDLPPPTRGELAEIAPALLVTPPKDSNLAKSRSLRREAPLRILDHASQS